MARSNETKIIAPLEIAIRSRENMGLMTWGKKPYLFKGWLLSCSELLGTEERGKMSGQGVREGRRGSQGTSSLA
jgi:hypothetical protein